MHVLKGAERAVFEELERALANGEQPSTYDLADLTLYHEATVKTAIQRLKAKGLIQVYRPGIGHKYTYQILQPS